MIVHCTSCGVAFKEEDEVRAEMDAYWHVLASRVNFAMSKPHNIVQSTLRHKSCASPEED